MSELNHVDLGEYWLAHHGIQGQKWGVQNGPPYPIPEGDHSAAEKKKMAKTYSKELNDNDKKMAMSKRNYYDSVKKTNTLSTKINKLKNKKQTESRLNKINKLESEKKESLQNESRYSKEINDAKEYAKKYVENLEKNGFTVKEINVTRNVTKGSEYAGMLAGVSLQTVASAAGLSSMAIYETHNVSGTKYKVKANKEQSNIDKKSLNDADKSRARAFDNFEKESKNTSKYTPSTKEGMTNIQNRLESLDNKRLVYASKVKSSKTESEKKEYAQKMYDIDHEIEYWNALADGIRVIKR